MTAILPWLIDLLEHTHHLELNPTLTGDYEGGSERIKGIATVWDSWVTEAVAGKIKIGQGGTAVYRPRYRNGWTGSKQ